jgi:hypothetical protein
MKTPTSNLVLGFTLIAVIGGGIGWFKWNEFQTQKTEEAANVAKAYELLDQLNDAKRQAKIETAILERKVLKHMNPRQVLQARGRPREIWTGSDLSDDVRKQGVVEAWIWGYANDGYYRVDFNINREVISTDEE